MINRPNADYISSGFEGGEAEYLDSETTATFIAAALSRYAPKEDVLSPQEKFEAAIKSGNFPETIALQVTSPRGVSITVEAAPMPPPDPSSISTPDRLIKKASNIIELLLDNPGRGFRRPELAHVTGVKSHQSALKKVKRVLTAIAVYPPDNHLLYLGYDGFNRLGEYYSLVHSETVDESFTTGLSDTSWEQDAECRGYAPEIFDLREAGMPKNSTGKDKLLAESICSLCTVSNECLVDSLGMEDVEFHMIRSGLGDFERRMIVKTSSGEGPEAAAQQAIVLQQAKFEAAREMYRRGKARSKRLAT